MFEMFKDKSYEPNHETIEDEDKDYLEQKCDFCSYHTFRDDQMKQHREWKHSTLVRPAKQSKKIKAPNSKEPESDRKWYTCGKKFGQMLNLKRQIENFPDKLFKKAVLSVLWLTISSLEYMYIHKIFVEF